jgi:pyruvate dehydrogenase E2 component (dihydrolipoamide acetyltransferase)
MIEFKLPSLGADMEEGTLLTWNIKPGDRVSRGQVVAVVDTTKAAIDVEIWRDGIVNELLVKVGEKLPVGTVMATLREEAEAEAAMPGPQAAVTQAPVLVMPEHQKDIRRTIAAAMSRSKREIPHYYMSEKIPMANALDWLSRMNEKLPISERILSAVLLLKAVAVALKRTPELNGFYTDDQFQASPVVHTGVAISLRNGGLVAPALHDVGGKSLAQLMPELSDLVKRARSGSLRSSEMSDPTITVTNLGEQSVASVFGVIYPPQVALVGFGGITAQPSVVNGKVRVQPLLCASLAADHRVSDGHRGALFLADLRGILQDPQALAEADEMPSKQHRKRT